jgi:predicted PurR-regulated permease PerM
MVTKIEIDTRTFIRFWLVVLGFVLAALFIWRAWPGLVVVVVSAFLAIALSPLIKKIDRILPGEKRGVAVMVTYALVVVAVGLILAVSVPAIISETAKFVKILPGVIEEATQNWEGLNRFGEFFGVENLQDGVLNWLGAQSEAFVASFGDTVLASVGAFGSALVSTVVVLIMTLFMLTEGPKVSAAIWQRYSGNVNVARAHRMVGKMMNVVAKFVSSQIVLALLSGVVSMITVLVAAMIFELPFGLVVPLGVIMAAFSVIPLFGPTVGCLIATALMVFNDVWAGVLYLVVMVVYMQIEANVLTPNVQGRGLQLPALVVLVAVTIGTYAAGFLGAVISIPIAGCVKVLIDEYSSNKTQTMQAKE